MLPSARSDQIPPDMHFRNLISSPSVWPPSPAAREHAPTAPDMIRMTMPMCMPICFFMLSICCRNLLRNEKLAAEPWTESVEQGQQRAEKCVRHMNAKYDLQGLRRGFPERLCKSEEAKCGRLRR